MIYPYKKGLDIWSINVIVHNGNVPQRVEQRKNISLFCSIGRNTELNFSFFQFIA